MKRAGLLVAAALAGCGDPVDDGSQFLPHLSDYHLFTGALADQKPVAGLVPYEVASPLYSDGAQKLRFIQLPAGAKIHFDATGRWQFPDGTTIVKTFYYDHDQRDATLGRRVLETRLLLNQGGAWSAITYVWNDAQTEADRFVAGKALHVDYIDPDGVARAVGYQVPSTPTCKNCHGQAKRFVPLGPRTRQLNRTHDYGAGAENQLAHFAAAGMFDGALPDPATLEALVEPRGTASVEKRARSWLEANCAHCHNGDGYASSTDLELEADTATPIDFGACRHPVAAGNASGGLLYDIVPGQPDNSIMIHRMKSNAPQTKMPQLPLTTVDEFGVKLVTDWITGLQGACQ